MWTDKDSLRIMPSRLKVSSSVSVNVLADPTPLWAVALVAIKVTEAAAIAWLAYGSTSLPTRDPRSLGGGARSHGPRSAGRAHRRRQILSAPRSSGASRGSRGAACRPDATRGRVWRTL